MSTLLVIAGAFMALTACGGGESKPENQILEERAFQAHSEYLLAEAELLKYRSANAGAAYRRELDTEAQGLLKECEAAITDEECPVLEPLQSVVQEIEARTHGGST